ncbi:hypothetical protein [Laspinema olomoucense]|uniref:hypothetical protein n=1 Tax=Laspinema olomoucense TaxID=3231600 RepID=UPI0021BA84D6|nr:hypothetical protein [Laspinema sp. D3a]MCT7988990.1 hypothetical protein [Laspinema sp. D3a]
MFKLLSGFQRRPQANEFQSQFKEYQGLAMPLEEMPTPSRLVLDDTEITEGFGADSDFFEFP